MKPCNIILSQEENYYGSAKKIKESAKNKINIIWIEDFNMNNVNKKKLKGSIVYILCNSPLVKKLIEFLGDMDCYIFNKAFFINNYDKLEIQKILDNNKIRVPKIMEEFDLEKINIPIFCKENKHSGMIFEAYTKNTIKKFFEKFNPKNFYLEETINKNDEIKYYYVKGKIYSKDNMPIMNIVEQYCIKISKILNLEVFSVDIIKSKEEYVIIDVNPSAGFYLLDEARDNLILEFERIK